jgi:transcriptional regulator with XRE-family HTH domain
VGEADEPTGSEEARRDQLVLGRTLRALRKRSGMTQEELAAKAGTMGYYISLIENGHRGLRWHMVMRLLRAMDVGPGEFGAEVERHLSSE